MRWEGRCGSLGRGVHLGLNGYPLQTAAQSGNGDRQNLGAVNSFWGKEGGCQLQTKNIIGGLAYSSCLYSLNVIRYMAYFV